MCLNPTGFSKRSGGVGWGALHVAAMLPRALECLQLCVDEVMVYDGVIIVYIYEDGVAIYPQDQGQRVYCACGVAKTLKVF